MAQVQESSLPANYPAEMVETARLKDGAQVNLRPILPEDAPRLQEGFSRLSPQTIYFRFLETFKELSDEQARHLSNLDYQTHMALVASIMEEGQERLIGVARYAMVGPHEPGLAEGGIVVRDDYQGRGLGKILMERLLRYGRKHGLSALLASTHLTNTRIMSFIQSSGLPFDRQMIEPGVWEIRIHIGESPEIIEQADSAPK